MITKKGPPILITKMCHQMKVPQPLYLSSNTFTAKKSIETIINVGICVNKMLVEAHSIKTGKY